MRQVGILFAILLVAACPPRRGRVVHVQPAATPAPVVSCAVSPSPAKNEEVVKPASPVDPAVATHLKSWEEKAAGRTNFRAEVALTRTDSVTRNATNSRGAVLLLKPSYAVLRLDNTSDRTKADYEALVWNGKAVYLYNGTAKTVTEFELPVRGPGFLNRFIEQSGSQLKFWFDLLIGAKVGALPERFDITLFKTDENYIYLDLKPRRASDQQEFKHLRVALYGSGPNTTKIAYTLAQVYVLKPNGDTELWKFTSPQVNIAGVEPKNFQYVEVKEEGWTFHKAGVGEADERDPAPKP